MIRYHSPRLLPRDQSSFFFFLTVRATLLKIYNDRVSSSNKRDLDSALTTNRICICAIRYFSTANSPSFFWAVKWARRPVSCEESSATSYKSYVRNKTTQTTIKSTFWISKQSFKCTTTAKYCSILQHKSSILQTQVTLWEKISRLNIDQSFLYVVLRASVNAAHWCVEVRVQCYTSLNIVRGKCDMQSHEGRKYAILCWRNLQILPRRGTSSKERPPRISNRTPVIIAYHGHVWHACQTLPKLVETQRDKTTVFKNLETTADTLISGKLVRAPSAQDYKLFLWSRHTISPCCITNTSSSARVVVHLCHCKA